MNKKGKMNKLTNKKGKIMNKKGKMNKLTNKKGKIYKKGKNNIRTRKSQKVKN